MPTKFPKAKCAVLKKKINKILHKTLVFIEECL